MRYLDEVSRDEVQGSQLLKNQKMRPSEEHSYNKVITKYFIRF